MNQFSFKRHIRDGTYAIGRANLVARDIKYRNDFGVQGAIQALSGHY